MKHEEIDFTGSGKSVVVRVEVMEKLARLEAKMDMLVGGTQPGRVKLIEERVTALEKNDVRRSVYDRLMNAGIAFIVSALIAMRDHFGFR